MKTTITLDSEVANNLNKLKYHYGFKTIEQVIKYHIKFHILKENQNENNKQNKNPVEEIQDEKLS